MPGENCLDQLARCPLLFRIVACKKAKEGLILGRHFQPRHDKDRRLGAQDVEEASKLVGARLFAILENLLNKVDTSPGEAAQLTLRAAVVFDR